MITYFSGKIFFFAYILNKEYAITYNIIVEWGNAAGFPFGFGVHNGVDLFVEFPT